DDQVIFTACNGLILDVDFLARSVVNPAVRNKGRPEIAAIAADDLDQVRETLPTEFLCEPWLCGDGVHVGSEEQAGSDRVAAGKQRGDLVLPGGLLTRRRPRVKR